MKQFAVIGLGNFGSAITQSLFSLGQEVLAVDSDPEAVDAVKECSTQAIVADPRDEDVLRSLGLRNFDAVVVAIGNDIQTSILVSLLCKEMGVRQLVCRARNPLHARVLEKIGADKVVFPERDMGNRLAHTLVSHQVLDVIELSADYSLVEVELPQPWFGKTLLELNIRQVYGLNVIALRRGGKTQISPKPDDLLLPGDVVTIVGSNENIHKIESRFDTQAKAGKLV